MNANARWCVLIPLAALVICGESALAQTQQQDAERMQREGVERADAAARAQGMEQQRQLQERERQAEESRRSESSSSTGGGYTPPHGGYAPSPSGGNSAGTGSDFGAMGKETLRLPPLPAERNVLLGSWRVEDGSQGGITRLGQAMGAGGTDAMLLDLWSTLESNPGKLLCEPMFGNGITFAPSTYAINALDGSVVRGSIAYRSPKAQVIVATPSNLRDPMIFEIADANRILFRGSCALVRVGAPAAGAAANATIAPGNARAAASGPSSPPADAATSTAAAGRAREPIAPTSRLGRGVQLHGEKDFQPALQELLVAAQSDPNDPRVYVYLADTYAWLGLDKEANQAAERAKQLDPNAFDILR